MSGSSQQPPCLTGVAADCFWIFQESRLARPSDCSVPTANTLGGEVRFAQQVKQGRLGDRSPISIIHSKSVVAPLQRF